MGPDVSWSGDRPEKIDGLLTYMTCDDTKCIFPPDVEFYLALDDALTEAVPELCPGDAGTVTESEDDVEMGDGLFVLFLLGMGLGFRCALHPCVFPLIPMTVSFFTKQSKTRAEGIRNALIYGASIIFIYTGLGLLLTAVFGVDVLNLISTDPYFNLFLFLLLVVFGVSFLGAFEIQLPPAGPTRSMPRRTAVASLASSSWRPRWPSSASAAPDRWSAVPSPAPPRATSADPSPSCSASRWRSRFRLPSSAPSRLAQLVAPKRRMADQRESGPRPA